VSYEEEDTCVCVVGSWLTSWFATNFSELPIQLQRAPHSIIVEESIQSAESRGSCCGSSSRTSAVHREDQRTRARMGARLLLSSGVPSTAAKGGKNSQMTLQRTLASSPLHDPQQLQLLKEEEAHKRHTSQKTKDIHHRRHTPPMDAVGLL